MVSDLAAEFSNFRKESKHLRSLLKDTEKCFADINSVKGSNGAQLLSAELTDTERQCIEEQTSGAPSIIVLGQSNAAKAFVVNEIFNRPILPVELSESSSDLVWRRVNFCYGDQLSARLCLPNSFEVLDSLECHSTSWRTIPLRDLETQAADYDEEELAKWITSLEVTLCDPLMKDGASLVLAPMWTPGAHSAMLNIYNSCVQGKIPVVVYAIANHYFSEEELSDLEFLKEHVPSLAIFFIKVPLISATLPPKPSSKTSPLEHVRQVLRRRSTDEACRRNANSFELFQQLLDLGLVSALPSSGGCSRQTSICSEDASFSVESELVENFDSFPNIVHFVAQVLQRHLVCAVSLLNVVHTRCLQNFIMIAFDMARDMMITPKRLEFARSKEIELYDSLMAIALKKQDEIKVIILDTITSLREDLLQNAERYVFEGVDIPESGEITSSKDLKTCTFQIQELVLGSLNTAIAGKLLGSVNILRDSYTGVLTRCLESLEQSDANSCAETMRTSLALREILTAAYQVEITVRAGTSIVKVLIEKMKQLVHAMPWKSPPLINSEWKRNVAADMLDSLSETRLAKSICNQIKERLKHSHETFSSALKQLEVRHSGRLERTEEQRLKVRKVYAPKVARLSLESTSLRDVILYGMPAMGREVGRGQYGVVYSCDPWGGFGPCAIKSVVPPDEKHWNDLALEFYYTKNVPEHERIVLLRGSVIDYTYGGGSSPAVLLIMERMQRDLYTAIKTGLDWLSRLQVAIDVVEGIRFLHSQGLVHRDIKLKNVLLNERNRACLTDLGFCKPEAMMSGSIVGTPIHMAPELFSGRYDNSVDVYAFGILFWYINSGNVKLPKAFEQCANKEMLWTSVRQGIRPEYLKHFDEECWQLMQACWHGDPKKRPLLGNVEPQLYAIYDRFLDDDRRNTQTRSRLSSTNNHHVRKRPSKSSMTS